MRKYFNKMNLEQCCADERPTLDSISTFSNYANCINDSLSEGNLKEKEENVDNNLCKTLFIEEILIEELNDYDMNQIMEDEALSVEVQFSVARTTIEAIRRTIHRG